MKGLGIFGLLATTANAYAPALSRVRKRDLPAFLTTKGADAVRQEAAEAKRVRRAERNRNKGL